IITKTPPQPADGSALQLLRRAAELALRCAVIVGSYKCKDAPQIVVRLHHLTHLWHRPHNILLGLAAVSLTLQDLRAVGDQAEQRVIIAPVHPRVVGERWAHAPAPGTPMTAVTAIVQVQ